MAKSTVKAGNYKVGYKRPPKERQFGQPNSNPRHNGAWKKTDTARYKLERMIELSNEELKAVYDDESRPLFERKLATFILNGDWKTYRDMIAEVYGQPKQKVETVDTTPHCIELTILEPKTNNKTSSETKQ